MSENKQRYQSPKFKGNVKPTILVDFDGVINSYRSGWQKNEAYLPDLPVLGAQAALSLLSQQYKVVVFSTRARTEAGKQAIESYLKKYGIYFDQITNRKLPAVMSIDDRAIRFRNWQQALKDSKRIRKGYSGKSELILLVGNVGTGKSTYAAQQEGIVVCLDTIVAGFENDRLYKKAHNDIYWAIEHTAVDESLTNNQRVIVDRTNVTRKDRQRFIELGQWHKSKILCVDFGKGNEGSLKRRMNDPREKQAEDWRAVHELLQFKYEGPSLDEGIDEIIEIVD
ncbi:MAG: AAA family ATPase [Candidatus Parabeggiatoa sp.]|nr:AAA family ATPase [Candidatus Parabeggiatoa sp.]